MRSEVVVQKKVNLSQLSYELGSESLRMVEDGNETRIWSPDDSVTKEELKQAIDSHSADADWLPATAIQAQQEEEAQEQARQQKKARIAELKAKPRPTRTPVETAEMVDLLIELQGIV